MSKKNIKKLIEKGGGSLKAFGDFVIPNSVTTIGDWAFRGCYDLTSITIPNSVTSIGSSAFENCSGLTSVTIPNSVTSMGKYAFSGCSGLARIVVESGNPKYDSRDNCNAIIETATNTLITGCKTTIIPNSVSSIRSAAFEGCSSLTSVTIPNSVKSIGCYAFNDCSSLTSITIPDSVTEIGIGALWWCENLTTIIIPRGSREKFEQLLPKELRRKLKEGTIDLSEGDVNFEEKYNEALKRAEILIEKLESAHIKGFIYHIFPELQESEDERIKKEILNLVAIAGSGNQFERIKDWLEKQGKTNASGGD